MQQNAILTPVLYIPPLGEGGGGNKKKSQLYLLKADRLSIFRVIEIIYLLLKHSPTNLYFASS